MHREFLVIVCLVLRYGQPFCFLIIPIYYTVCNVHNEWSRKVNIMQTQHPMINTFYTVHNPHIMEAFSSN